MKKIRAKLLSARIERQWRGYILPGRKRGGRWISQGMALTDKRLLALNRRLTRHAVKTMRLTEKYRLLAGVE